MLQFIVRTALSAVALLAIAGVSNGQIQVNGFTAALLAALILGLANSIIKPILQYATESLTCVLSCLTLGLWSLFVSVMLNGLIFFMAGRGLVPGFEVRSFWPALWGALVLSGVNALVTVLMRPKDERER